jgi:hypothetical protein
MLYVIKSGHALPVIDTLSGMLFFTQSMKSASDFQNYPFTQNTQNSLFKQIPPPSATVYSSKCAIGGLLRRPSDWINLETELQVQRGTALTQSMCEGR